MAVMIILGISLKIVYVPPPPKKIISENMDIDNRCEMMALRLSRNEGHQNALLAGLMEVKEKCDCAISIDGDLQQDEEKFDNFLEKFKNGAEIVIGIRNDRNSDGLFKKITAQFFYSLMSFFGTKTVKNHADYRLMGKNALMALSNFKEKNLFLRGLIFELGFNVDRVFFDVKKRIAGSSKYSLGKMITFAWNGITSFSVFPLRMISVVGFFVFLLACLFGFYALFVSLCLKSAVPGWTSTVVPIYFLGGIQLLSLGVIGEYIGKIYQETKSRPRYIVEDKIKTKNIIDSHSVKEDDYEI